MNVVPKYEDRYPFYKDREQYQVLIEAGFIDGGDGNLYVSQYVMPLSKLRPGSLEYRVVQAYEDWKNLSPYSDGRTEQRIQQEQIFAGTMGDLHRLQGDAYQAGLTRPTAYYNATLPRVSVGYERPRMYVLGEETGKPLHQIYAQSARRCEQAIDRLKLFERLAES